MMNRAQDVDEEDDPTPTRLAEGGESPFVLLPFLMPMPIFKMLNEEARKLGMTVPNFVTRSLQEKLERLQKEKEHGSV